MIQSSQSAQYKKLKGKLHEENQVCDGLQTVFSGGCSLVLNGGAFVNEQELAKQIAAQVLKDTQFWIAIVGIIGAVIGSILALVGNLLLHWFQDRKQSALDTKRMSLLKQMLERSDWRHLSTMSRVIGTSPDETRRLLIKLGARASESERPDGEEAWALLSRKPLSQIQL